MNAILGFKVVQLFKDQTLGIGSFGKVCKAKCDSLVCAAKILHPTLFNPTAKHQVAPHKEHRLPAERFKQECEFLSTLKHPNIVQYLGIHQDPDMQLSALLMELLDDNLTNVLEGPQPLPYHIQVNICHDITLALSFLHSNSIIHRDLSSNNVLLMGKVKAKVTDFGMARLGEINPHMSCLTFTKCPGTDVYMPPEAVKEEPVYTEKIDCFSFGVIVIQILTRQYPAPSNRYKEIHVDDFGLVHKRLPEIERRQNHISRIHPSNSLLPVALECLNDNNAQRPAAQQLCERMAFLKEAMDYQESVRKEKEEILNSEEKQEHAQDLHHNIIAALELENQELKEQLQHCIEMTGQLEQERERITEERERIERQLVDVNKLLNECEQTLKEFQRQLSELEQIRGQQKDLLSKNEAQSTIKIRWKEGSKTPSKMSALTDAVLHNDSVYIIMHTDTSRIENKIYVYRLNSALWSQLPNCPTLSCPLVIIGDLPTLIGGFRGISLTNKLYSLVADETSDSKEWIQKFPPMPSKRWGTAAVCTCNALIVAGGGGGGQIRRTVEVMRTETHQWFTATDLPKPLCHSSIKICGDRLYIIGGVDENLVPSKSVYAYHASDAPFQSVNSEGPVLEKDVNTCANVDQQFGASLQNKIADLPVTQTTCIVIKNSLLAIGGKDSDNKCTTAIHMYNPARDSWEAINHMATPRSRCFAVVLPNNQLMIVGGRTLSGDTDTVELIVLF